MAKTDFTGGLVSRRDEVFWQAAHLQKEVEWFIAVLNGRLADYFDDKNSDTFTIDTIPPPVLDGEPTLYSEFIDYYELPAAERLVLLLALMPHLQPQVLDVLFSKNQQYERGYTEFGGVKGTAFSGFMPTGETALFLLAGNDIGRRMIFSHVFDEDHLFASHKILWLENQPASEPFLSGVLTLSEEFLDYFLSGKVRKPKFSSEFPAKKITTPLGWDDLVLEPYTQEQINELLAWVEYGDKLMNEWGLGKKLKPGYKCLFHGPPGTGKTLTATLIGKTTGKEVYRVDLSMIVSKYIGETEKNLSKVFDRAANKEWILFFDEADALFGKRTNVADSHDRYANQEVSFLLQKIEEHNGLVILATNLKSNIDEAFTRRFQSIVHFPMPKPAERLALWKNAFSEQSVLEEQVNLKQIAEKFELSGGSIINVIRYASLMALRNDTNIIREKWLLTGIRKEFLKEGKTL